MDKNKLMMIIIIILLVVLLGAVAGVAFVLLNNMPAAPDSGTPGITEVIDDEPRVLSIMDEASFDIEEPFKTNLLNEEDGSGHVISIKISIGYDNSVPEEGQKCADMLSEKMVMIKDAMLSILHSTRLSDIDGNEGIDKLRETMLIRLQEMFDSNQIIKVYFIELYKY